MGSGCEKLPPLNASSMSLAMPSMASCNFLWASLGLRKSLRVFAAHSSGVSFARFELAEGEGWAPLAASPPPSHWGAACGRAGAAAG
eukprot:9414253-Pyramimonas_sp.AAC.1